MKFKFLRNTAAASDLDRRENSRIHHELDIQGKVTLSPDGPELVGQVAHFITRDVSTSGVLVRSDRDLPTGCLLDLSLNLPGKEKPLSLQALVKWNSADTEQNEFLLGIELRERPPKEYCTWRDRILKQMRFHHF